MDVWQVLGIAATDDPKVVRRAYAQLLKLNNPEDDPKAFERLRKAYEIALRWAEAARDRDEEPDEWLDAPDVRAQELRHAEPQVATSLQEPREVDPEPAAYAGFALAHEVMHALRLYGEPAAIERFHAVRDRPELRGLDAAHDFERASAELLSAHDELPLALAEAMDSVFRWSLSAGATLADMTPEIELLTRRIAAAKARAALELRSQQDGWSDRERAAVRLLLQPYDEEACRRHMRDRQQRAETMALLAQLEHEQPALLQVEVDWRTLRDLERDRQYQPATRSWFIGWTVCGAMLAVGMFADALPSAPEPFRFLAFGAGGLLGFGAAHAVFYAYDELRRTAWAARWAPHRELLLLGVATLGLPLSELIDGIGHLGTAAFFALWWLDGLARTLILLMLATVFGNTLRTPLVELGLGTAEQIDLGLFVPLPLWVLEAVERYGRRHPLGWYPSALVHAFALACVVIVLRVALNALRGAPLMEGELGLAAFVIGVAMVLSRWTEEIPLVRRPASRFRGYYR